MNPLWLLRMSRWVRQPPSRRRLIVAAVVVALVVTIWGLEHWGLWPDWATAEKMRRAPRLLQ